jgi:hypothetical protein
MQDPLISSDPDRLKPFKDRVYKAWDSLIVRLKKPNSVKNEGSPLD